MDSAFTDPKLRRWLRWASERGNTPMFVRTVAEAAPARAIALTLNRIWGRLIAPYHPLRLSSMSAPPIVRFFVRAYLAAVLVAVLMAVGARGTDQVPPLPPLTELQKLVWEPASDPDLVGIPSYQELKGVLASFRNYVRGSKLVARFEEPIVTRGGQGISVYRKAASAVVLVLAGNVKDDKVTDVSVGSGVNITLGVLSRPSFLFPLHTLCRTTTRLGSDLEAADLCHRF